jgi:hypothetical protein
MSWTAAHDAANLAREGEWLLVVPLYFDGEKWRRMALKGP